MKHNDRPLPVTIENLITNEKKGFMANPNELNWTLSADYNEPNVIGMGNVPLGYKRTKNLVFNLTFFLSAEYIVSNRNTNKSIALDTMENYRNFYISLLYPHRREGDSSVIGEPPKVRLIWNGLVAISGRVTNLKWTGKLFQLDMKSNFEVATMTIKADQNYPIWADLTSVFGLDLEV